MLLPYKANFLPFRAQRLYSHSFEPANLEAAEDNHLAKSTGPHIFVSLAAPSLNEMEVQAARVGGASIGYELRLDALQDYGDLETRLHQMLLRLHVPQTIATCRRSEAGGSFHGTVQEQAGVLAAALRAGCQWVDVEIESVDRAGSSWLERTTERTPGRLSARRCNVERPSGDRLSESSSTMKTRAPIGLILPAGWHRAAAGGCRATPARRSEPLRAPRRPRRAAR